MGKFSSPTTGPLAAGADELVDAVTGGLTPPGDSPERDVCSPDLPQLIKAPASASIVKFNVQTRITSGPFLPDRTSERDNARPTGTQQHSQATPTDNPGVPANEMPITSIAPSTAEVPAINRRVATTSTRAQMVPDHPQEFSRSGNMRTVWLRPKSNRLNSKPNSNKLNCSGHSNYRHNSKQFWLRHDQQAHSRGKDTVEPAPIIEFI
jgi:hypothetical protein